jgi:thiazole/oxazole-forming peptide maturase SagD family component
MEMGARFLIGATGGGNRNEPAPRQPAMADNGRGIPGVAPSGTRQGRLEIVPFGTGSAVCTASGRWSEVPIVPSLLAQLLDQDAGSAPPMLRDGVARDAVAQLEASLRQEESPALDARCPGGLYAVGDIDLCRRLKALDGSGTLQHMLTAGDRPPDDVPGRLTLVLAVGRGYRAMLEPDVRLLLGKSAWLPCAFVEGGCSLGPLCGAGEAISLADLVVRRRAAARNPALACPEEVLSVGEWADDELAWIASILALEVNRFWRDGKCQCAGHEMMLRPGTMSVSRHRVIPLPFHPENPWQPNPHRPAGFVPIEDVIDSRTGIITGLRRIEHHESVPQRLITMQATITDMRRVSPWLTDPAAAGCSFTKESDARAAAIGEAIERYAGEIVQAGLLRRATWHEIAARGEDAVDPDSLELFSARQYGTKGFPFVPLTRDLPIQWVRGWCLSDDRPAWLPASLVYPNWYTGGNENDPHTNNPFYPGLAAGPDLDFALAAGIQEVIERDATMVWWANAHRLPGVRLSPSLLAVWEGVPTELGQRAWIIHLDNEFGVPVMAGMVENTAEQLFTMGFAARPDPVNAAQKAWAEALTLQDMSRDLLKPQGNYRQAAARGDVNGRFVKSFRKDRRYLDDYRADQRDVVDLMCQLQMYLDPRAVERVRPWADVPPERDIEDIAPLADGSLATYRRVVESRGYRIYYADLTTSDVAATGYRVVRVLIPGTVPNYAAAFPFQGRGRIRSAAVDLGWRKAPLAEEEINTFPVAHA